jgi:hypothetical protein
VELVKSQRNDLFEAIHAAGLDPREFELAEEDGDRRLRHRWSESYFVIGGGHGHFVGRYVVGDDSPREYEVHIWPVLVDRVHRWLANVCAFLASDEASFVTGVVWVIDGGTGISRGLPGRLGDIPALPLTLPVRHSLGGFEHAIGEKPGEAG